MDVDFAAYPGEYLGIIGHTGSGKSTLIQHLNGLLKPTSGQVLFQGTDIWTDLKTTRRTRFQVGLVFQYPEYQLFEETVYKDISFGPKNMGLDEKEVDRRVRSAAYFVGLRDDQLNQSPFELSGGQKRRVAIAGVIAMEPKVLILDEPTAGLDPVGTESILSNIRAYHKAQNATIIMVSHSMEEMARTVDRLVVVNDGKIALEGAPSQVFQHGQELEDMGLGIPQMTRVFNRLKPWAWTWAPLCTPWSRPSGPFWTHWPRRGWAEMALKDITLGQYFPGHSLVHRLDPRTKILAVVIYIVALFLAKSFVTYAIMFALLALSVKISTVPVKSLVRGMKPVVFILIFTAVLNLFYTPGEHVLFQVWILTVTLEGVQNAFFMVIRILMLIAGTFCSPTPPPPSCSPTGWSPCWGP